MPEITIPSEMETGLLIKELAKCEAEEAHTKTINTTKRKLRDNLLKYSREELIVIHRAVAGIMHRMLLNTKEEDAS